MLSSSSKKHGKRQGHGGTDKKAETPLQRKEEVDDENGQKEILVSQAISLVDYDIDNSKEKKKTPMKDPSLAKFIAPISR